MGSFVHVSPSRTLYLWRYYEWIQFNRVTKRRLKSRTTTLTVYFYNPLLVPGARRLRLAASNVELTPRFSPLKAS